MRLVEKNGQLGVMITHVNEEGIKKRTILSLKKIAITGLIAIGIAASIKPISNEISFKVEKGKIENLKETADEISKLDNNTTVIDGEEIKIADKVIELAEKQENYNNAKHDNASKEQLEKLKEEITNVQQQIYDIGLEEIKEAAAPHFEDIEGTTLTVRRDNTDVLNQTDSIIQENVITEGLTQTRNIVNSYELDNQFAGNVIQGDNIDKVIELMPDFLENGLEVSEDDKSLH